jgi:hypothetical protein
MKVHLIAHTEITCARSRVSRELPSRRMTAEVDDDDEQMVVDQIGADGVSSDDPSRRFQVCECVGACEILIRRINSSLVCS